MFTATQQIIEGSSTDITLFFPQGHLHSSDILSTVTKPGDSPLKIQAENLSIPILS